MYVIFAVNNRGQARRERESAKELQSIVSEGIDSQEGYHDIALSSLLHC